MNQPDRLSIFRDFKLCCVVIILSTLVLFYKYIQSDSEVNLQPEVEFANLPKDRHRVGFSEETKLDSKETSLPSYSPTVTRTVGTQFAKEEQKDSLTVGTDISNSHTEVHHYSPAVGTNQGTDKPAAKSNFLKNVTGTEKSDSDKILVNESPTVDQLSSIDLKFDANHINGKLLEPVDVQWDNNIYFSVKTTTKNFKTRLSYLIATWFQVVNKKMVSIYIVLV